MKKLLVLLILSMTGSPFFAHSQGVSIGVKTGMNLYNIYSTESTESAFRAGVHFGIYTNYPITERWSYSPEVMYSRQGFELIYQEDLGTSVLVIGESDVNTHYLNFLPITAKCYIGDAKLISLLLGPQLGWLLAAREVGEYDGEAIDNKVTESFHKFDVSAVLGLGVDLKSGLNFGCRMNLGLTDIIDWPENVEPGKIKNIVFQAHIGYTFIKR